jgi:hypothetical protein
LPENRQAVACKFRFPISKFVDITDFECGKMLVGKTKIWLFWHSPAAFPRHRRSKDFFALMEIMFAMWNING